MLKRISIVVLVTAVAAGCAGGSDDGSQLTAAGREAPATTDSTTTTPTSPSPDPADPASYYSLDGTPPALSPECDGVLSLCLGNPVEKAVNLLGLEDERYGSAEAVSRIWTVAGKFRVRVGSDAVGSITSLSVSLGGAADGRSLIALPSGVVLGRSTMADVASALGVPEPRELTGEGYTLYDYAYQTGPEGTWEISFGHEVDWTVEEPFLADGVLPTRPVMTFSVTSEPYAEY